MTIIFSMNIFAVDPNPIVCAESLCNQHVIKMIVESAQMLSTNIRLLGLKDPKEKIEELFPSLYRSTHKHHPCTIWAQSKPNFEWLLFHALALCDEYTFRFGKSHKTVDLLLQIHHGLYSINFKSTQRSVFRTAINTVIFHDCVVHTDLGAIEPHATYQRYISKYKRQFGTKRPRAAKWTKRKPPLWFNNPPCQVNQVVKK